MVGIAKNDFSADVIFKLVFLDRLYSALGSYRHENRGLNCAVICFQAAQTGFCLVAFFYELKQGYLSFLLETNELSIFNRLLIYMKRWLK
jgi:hypothetical protein